MALIKCPECGKEVSDQAESCIHCGHPLKEKQPTQQQVIIQQPKKKSKLLGCLGFLALAIVVVIVVIIAVNQSPSTAPPTTNTQNKSAQKAENTLPPAIVVSAKQLLKEYDENGVKADEDYKGKTLEVSGIVDTIDKDFLDKPYVTLGTGEDFEFVTVQCYFTKDMQSALSSLKSGSKITVVGTGGGKSLNVIMNNCSIK